VYQGGYNVKLTEVAKAVVKNITSTHPTKKVFGTFVSIKISVLAGGTIFVMVKAILRKIGIF
jgi:hypothetical protein